MNILNTYARTALALLTGERCVVCGTYGTASLCPECLLRMPYACFRGTEANPVELLFWGQIPVMRASSMLTFQPGNEVGRLIHAIKYDGRKDLAVEMGRCMAQELLPTGFFDGMDHLQPVPLHPNRQRQRGYNQSEELARGIAEVTGLPLGHFVKRVVDNVSQTHIEHHERHDNVKDIFVRDETELKTRQPRHVLIVDDVITTGATTTSCAKALAGITDDIRQSTPGLSISVLSLAFAGAAHMGRSQDPAGLAAKHEVSNADFRERMTRPLF